MADDQFLSSEEAPPGGISVEGEDVPTAPPAEPPRRRFKVKAPRPTIDARLAVREVAGRPPVDRAAEATDEDDAEIVFEAESDQEATIEAEAAQLEESIPAEDDAFADLREIEGFAEHRAESAPAAAAEPVMLPDAGSALAPQQEVFGAIASTVVPVLASQIGPAVAKAAAKRLAPAAKAALRRHGKGIGLLATAARLFEAAEEQPVAAAEASLDGLVDEAVIDEVVRTMEVIIGTDDRVRITTTTQIPWRRYCALRIHMPSGAQYRGTGFFIGRRTVATAGHCIYIKSQGGWARKVEVIPGCNGSQRPFGQVEATAFRSVSGWVNAGKPESDYGCIVLPSGAFGGSVGHFGFAVFSSAELLAGNAVLAGYPGDKPFAEIWGMGRRIKSLTPTQLVYDIDTVGGQSGAPVYMMRGGSRYVVGIHNYGAATGNSATRITPGVFQNLRRWSNIG